MTIRRPLEEGATQLPGSAGVGTNVNERRAPPSSLDSVLRMKEKMAASRELDRMIAPEMGPPPNQPTFQFTGNMDIGAMFAANQAQAQAAQQQLTTFLTTFATQMTDAQKQQMELYKERLNQIEQRMTGPSEVMDPITQLRQTKGLLDDLSKDIRSSLGLGDGFARSSDLGPMLEIKKMELEASERRSQWEAEQKQKDREWQLQLRKWDIESQQSQQRWAAEFGLKREEAQLNRKKSQETMDMFGDLISSWAGNVDQAQVNGAMAGVGPGPAAREAAPQAQLPTFECPGCGSPVPYLENAVAVLCPSCGMEHTRGKQDEESGETEEPTATKEAPKPAAPARPRATMYPTKAEAPSPGDRMIMPPSAPMKTPDGRL